MNLFTNCLLRAVTVGIYCILGAVLFVQIENKAIETSSNSSQKVNETEDALNKLRSNYTCRLSDISVEELKSLAKAVIDLTAAPQQKWTLGTGLQLAFETLTTVGYGSNAPTTEIGRILIIFYALVGIPLYLYFLQIVGEVINKAINKALWIVENKCLKVKEPKSVELKCLVGFTVSLVTYVLSMAAFFKFKYKWTYLDSVYALIITFTTVGFGDFIISRSESLVVVIGLCLVSGLFDAVMCYMEKKAEERRNNAEKNCCCFGKQTEAVNEENNHDCTNKLCCCCFCCFLVTAAAIVVLVALVLVLVVRTL